MSNTYYVRTFDLAWDEDYQVEVDEATAAKARAAGSEVSPVPFKGLPIRPRSRAAANEQRAAEAGHDTNP